MIIKTPVAMKFALGENPKCVYNEKDEAPVTRMGTMALIRELLIKSRDYMNQLDAYNENSEEHDKPEFDIKLDCNDTCTQKTEIPVKIHSTQGRRYLQLQSDWAKNLEYLRYA